MGTLTSLFDLTRTALAADQVALNATSINVANQNTTGYVRRTVSFTAGDSVSLGYGSQTAATGPTVATVAIRDRVLEQRVQHATQQAASSSTQAGVYSQIESVFSLAGSSATAGSTQIGTAINSFFSSLTSLASSPSDTASRQGVLSAATALGSAFNSAASQLSQVGTSLKAEVGTTVGQVNGLAATIAKLNQQIGSVSPSGDSGTLEDQRQTAIAQLSQLVGLDQITTENNGITLTTQGGAVLVSGSQAYGLNASTVGGNTVVKDSTGADITAGIMGGTLGGDLTSVNTTLPGVTGQLDAVAYRIATAVNAQNAAGQTSSGSAGAAIFAIGSSAAGAAGTISVIPTSAAAIATAGPGEGSAGNTNALSLEGLQTAVDASGLTISGQFAATLSAVGTASAAVSEQNTTDQASLSQLTTQRDSLSGVSLDDEAANLSQYQRSYEAAAKVLSVLDTLLAAAINIGTQTAVS